ncbi:MAG: hypothetical protein C5B60_09120 [Chloroflexi bacterium]|nr:MAG: hypothetical protein C5B60_09120 [Chloroflexota bacterium]
MRSTQRVSKPSGYRPLLNIDQNAKTVKGQAKGYMTAVLYLAPADLSGVMNTCTFAGYCKAFCLNLAGRGAFTKTQIVRIAKTVFLHENRALFLECLRYDVEKLIRKAERKGLIPCLRVNGTSDMAWLGMLMASEFPGLQCYDYTKLPKPELRVRGNYHLTFSYDGNAANVAECERVLSIGMNVSMVFDAPKGKALPTNWQGYRVVDGDESDLRFLDDKGVVVGLRAKGPAKKACTPFVVAAASAPLVQILPMAA